MTGAAGKASKPMPNEIRDLLVLDYQIGMGETWLKGPDWIGRILNAGMSVGQYWTLVNCDPKIWRSIEIEAKYKAKSVPWTWRKLVERSGQV